MVLVGQRTTVTKPSRSDDVLDPDQQLKIASQIRAQFDSTAPKRPTKPNRSEPDSSSTTPTPVDSISDQTIPELHKLRSLQSQSHFILSDEGALTVQDEFVDTQYYKELNSIDKEHHKTGNGFIRVDHTELAGYDIRLPESENHGGTNGLVVHMGFRSNPATNDWTPKSDEDEVLMISSKPNRSESSD